MKDDKNYYQVYLSLKRFGIPGEGKIYLKERDQPPPISQQQAHQLIFPSPASSMYTSKT